MKSLVVLSLLFLPILNNSFAGERQTKPFIAELQALQSYGKGSTPALIRTLYVWDISNITENISPNSSSDGEAVFLPDLSACVTLSRSINQEKAKRSHIEILESILAQKSLSKKRKQKLETELKYIDDYNYGIKCRGISSDLAKLKEITGKDPAILREQMENSNKKFSLKPRPMPNAIRMD